MQIDGVKVRYWRERRFISQENLAKQAGLSEITLNRIERGLQQPRLSTIGKLVKALGVSVDEILVREHTDMATYKLQGERFESAAAVANAFGFANGDDITSREQADTYVSEQHGAQGESPLSEDDQAEMRHAIYEHYSL